MAQQLAELAADGEEVAELAADGEHVAMDDEVAATDVEVVEDRDPALALSELAARVLARDRDDERGPEISDELEADVEMMTHDDDPSLEAARPGAVDSLIAAEALSHVETLASGASGEPSE